MRQKNALRKLFIVSLSVWLALVLTQVTRARAIPDQYFGWSGDSLFDEWFPNISDGACTAYWSADFPYTAGDFGFRADNNCTGNGTKISIHHDIDGAATLAQISVQLSLNGSYTPGLESATLQVAAISGTRTIVTELPIVRDYWFFGYVFPTPPELTRLQLTVLMPASVGYGTPRIQGVYAGFNTLAATSTPRSTQPPFRTLPPSLTPFATVFSYPTSTPAATRTIVHTKIAPRLSPYPTIDTCSFDLALPCATLADLPTIVIPTVNLPSPTLRPTRPSSTPVPITATPSFTPTPSITPSPTNIPNTTPTPTSQPANLQEINDLGLGIGNTIPTVVPALNAQIVFAGTPTGLEDFSARAGASIGTIVAVGRGLELLEFNKVGGLVTFALLVGAFSVLAQTFWVSLPILSFIAKWLYNLLTFIVNGIRSLIRR